MQLANRTTAAFLSAARFFQQPLFSSSNQTMTTTTRAPVIAVCHGGGPMPLLGDPEHKELIASMSTVVPQTLQLGTANAPRAIVVVTAHWTTSKPTVSAAESHGLLFDYGGFPKESYEVRYEARGSPEVARLVGKLLGEGGFEGVEDLVRGWDHGVFVPLTLINPKADIPIIQLSVLATEDASKHFAIGKALSPLRDQGIAIIGSGMPTFHNLRLMFGMQNKSPAEQREILGRNERWSEKLTEAVMLKSSEEREEKLRGWRGWEGSWEAHPKGGAEHLFPLFVCAGAAGEGEGVARGDMLFGSRHFSYSWT